MILCDKVYRLTTHGLTPEAREKESFFKKIVHKIAL